MWIGGIKVPKLINWLQRKFYDSSPDFVANTYRTSEDALIMGNVRDRIQKKRKLAEKSSPTPRSKIPPKLSHIFYSPSS